MTAFTTRLETTSYEDLAMDLVMGLGTALRAIAAATIKAGQDFRSWVDTAPLANFLYWGPRLRMDEVKSNTAEITTVYTDEDLVPDYSESSLEDSDFDYDVAEIARFEQQYVEPRDEQSESCVSEFMITEFWGWNDLTVKQLKQYAKANGVKGWYKMRKSELYAELIIRAY